MATVITIGGSPIDLKLYNVRPSLTLRFDGRSTLTLQRRGGKLPGLPDPWLGKRVTLAIDGTDYFAGDVASMTPQWTGVGWTPTYLCRDIKSRCDRIPLTDDNTHTDTSSYNLPPTDPAAIASRQGRNVGQILADVLTGLANAQALDAKGVGGYTGLPSAPVLPASTVADLALLTVIPPAATYVQGERLLTALEGFLRFWAPNHLLWIEPATGHFRFLDKRTFSATTLTMGTDPVFPTPLVRDVGECYQRVVVRGQPVAEPKLISISNGGLAEDFAWGVYSNSAAKANWTPAIGAQDSLAKSEGTCVCTDTLNVVVNPADNSQAWAANFWDQTGTGHRGFLQVEDTGLAGVNMFVQRRIVSNGSLVAAGTCTCTLDYALPGTSYAKFKLYGISTGASLVWKKYSVTDPDIAAALTNYFTWEQPFVGANGNVATMTSTPMGSVCWSSTGSPPYDEWPCGITIDPDSGHVYFLQATFSVAGNRVPSDVRALVAVNTGNLTAIKPANTGTPAITPAYEGTSHTVEGMEETLTVSVGQWRDPINQSAMDAYAQDLLDSVKDAVIEGEVTYAGKYLAALTPGIALEIHGNGYTTGWEGLPVPVLEVELRWNSGVETQFTTTMRCGNRRASLTSSAYLRPDRQVGGQVLDMGGLNTAALASQAGSYAAQAGVMAVSPGAIAGSFGGAAGGLSAFEGVQQAAGGMAGLGDSASGAFAAAAGLGDQSAGVELPGWADPSAAVPQKRHLNQQEQVQADADKEFRRGMAALERALKDVQRKKQSRALETLHGQGYDPVEQYNARLDEDAARRRSAPDQGD